MALGLLRQVRGNTAVGRTEKPWAVSPPIICTGSVEDFCVVAQKPTAMKLIKPLGNWFKRTSTRASHNIKYCYDHNPPSHTLQPPYICILRHKCVFHITYYRHDICDTSLELDPTSNAKKLQYEIH
jgi:hypothetical protein